MNYSTMIAGVNDGTKYAYRGIWPSPRAIVKVDGVVQLWEETSQGTYSPSAADTAATDWIMAPYDGDLPPRQ